MVWDWCAGGWRSKIGKGNERENTPIDPPDLVGKGVMVYARNGVHHAKSHLAPASACQQCVHGEEREPCVPHPALRVWRYPQPRTMSRYLMAYLQRIRIQPHTQRSRESAHLTPRVRLGGNAPAATTPRRRRAVAQDSALHPPNPALAGPPALHRELVAAMVTRPWHAIESDEACTPLASRIPTMVVIHTRYARLGEDTVAAPAPEASVQGRDNTRFERTRSWVARPEPFSTPAPIACAHGRRTRSISAFTSMPGTHLDEHERKQHGSNALAPGYRVLHRRARRESHAEAVRRVVWLLTRKSRPAPASSRACTAATNSCAQRCVCSWMSFSVLLPEPAKHGAQTRWVMQQSEVGTAVGCGIFLACPAGARVAPQDKCRRGTIIAVVRVRRHVRPIRTHWQACRQIIVNREKSVPNITIPLIVVSNVDDALIATLMTPFFIEEPQAVVTSHVLGGEMKHSRAVEKFQGERFPESSNGADERKHTMPTGDSSGPLDER
ncbi:hypothetical protein B0H11DRAFT_2366122 [Mycena galericulata]|nr:hypothetical protein B0H11DRAFT_2366122 [Mycena galericulata]